MIVAIIGTATIINDDISPSPGALDIGSDVPDGAQIAVIFARFAGVEAGLTALSSSFGDVTILGNEPSGNSGCALAYVEVDDWGDSHTITPTYGDFTQTPQVFGLIFLDGLDVSSESAWLRDFGLNRDGGGGTASVTIDTEPDDHVLAGLGQWSDTPAAIVGTTTLIAPLTDGNNRHRVVSQNTPSSGTATFSTASSYPSAAALSIIPADGGTEVLGVVESLLLSAAPARISSNRSITAALESILLTSLHSTVSSSRAIAGAVESLAVSALPAIVSSNRNIQSALESLGISTLRATVSSARNIVGGTEQIALSALPASILIGATIQGSTEQIALAAYASSVFAGDDSTIAAGTESLSLQTLPASLSLGLAMQVEQITLGTLLAVILSNRSISGAIESLLLDARPAGVSLGSLIGVGTEQISLQTSPAQIRLNVAISAQLESILLTELSAQIGLGQNFNAAVESLVVTPLGATLRLDSGVSAHLETLRLSTFTAHITSTVAPIVVPGLEYTLRGGPLHYVLPINKLHFTFRG